MLAEEFFLETERLNRPQLALKYYTTIEYFHGKSKHFALLVLVSVMTLHARFIKPLICNIIV